MAQDPLDQGAEARRAGQIVAVACHIDPGQDNLAMALLDEPRDTVDRCAGGDRAAVAASERDDAECAAVVAAVLHLDKRAGVFGKGVGELRRGFAHRHDVGDADALDAL